MSSFVRRFLTMLFFLCLSAGIIDVVTSIYIWQISQSLTTVLLYMGVLFVAIIPSSLLVGLLIDTQGGLLPLLLSLLSFGLNAAFFVIFPDFVLQHIWIFGALAGFANTAFYLSTRVIAHVLISASEQATYNTYFSNFLTVSYLCAPLILMATQFFGLPKSSALGVAAISAVFGLLSLFNLTELRQTVNVLDFSVFNPWTTNNPERSSLFWFSFVWGIKNGVFWAFFGVIILMTLGSVSYWGVVTIVLKIISIGTTLLLKKIGSFAKFQYMLLGSSLVYLGVIVIVLANVSAVTFLLFAVFDAVINQVFLQYYHKLCYELTQLDTQYQNKITEYGIFEEVSVTLGRLFSLALLGPVFVLATQTNNQEVIVLTFMILSFAPLLFFKIAQKSPFLSKKMHLRSFGSY